MGGIVGPAFVADASTHCSAAAIANYFLKNFGGDSGISHMKLQKMVYLSYGWWLSNYDRPLIGEAPQVWKYGPVFDSLYQSLRTKGKEPLREKVIPSFEFSSAPEIESSDEETAKLLSWVWARYGDLDGIALSEITHQPNTPWSEVVASHEFKIPRNLPLDWGVVKKHYETIKERHLTSEHVQN